MTTLVDLLSQLDRVLDDLGAPVVPHLRGPAPAKQVTAMLVADQIQVHPDVLTWWGWHDGTHLPSATQPPGEMLPELRNQLISGLHMPTLAQAQTARRHALDLDAQVGLVSFWPTWSRYWNSRTDGSCASRPAIRALTAATLPGIPGMARVKQDPCGSGIHTRSICLGLSGHGCRR